MHFLPLARALGPDIPVYGLQAYGLENHEPFHQSFQEMARFYRQELQTVQPHGPYRLLSHCQGIPIVLELAEQLLNSGENVELVALVDASNFLRSAEEVQKADPEFLSRVVLYGLTRRSIYQHLRQTDDAAEAAVTGMDQPQVQP